MILCCCSTGLNQALNNLERFVLANQRYDSIWSFWNKPTFLSSTAADIDDTVCASLFLQDKYPAIEENKSIFSSLENEIVCIIPGLSLDCEMYCQALVGLITHGLGCTH